MPQHMLSLDQWSPEELTDLVELAIAIKSNPDEYSTVCKGQTLAMIFQKPSLRTRVSFQTGIYQLGGQGIYLGPTDIQLHRGESIADTSKVLSRFVDGIMARVFAHKDVQDLAENATIPVINGLSDWVHPCQVLADLQTIKEHKGSFAGRKWAYVGDGNNMAHSILLGGVAMGMIVSVSHPVGYAPDPAVVKLAEGIAAKTGGGVQITDNPVAGVRDADVVYTDVWASMGQEAEQQERLARFDGFMVDAGMMEHAKPDAIFLHCLPAHRGEEVAAEVIDGPQSVVFDQAENRLHAQKALMVRLMGRDSC